MGLSVVFVVTCRHVDSSPRVPARGKLHWNDKWGRVAGTVNCKL